MARRYVTENPATELAVPNRPILVSGHCDDLVVLDGDVALFEKRIVVLDNTPPRYLVYPV